MLVRSCLNRGYAVLSIDAIVDFWVSEKGFAERVEKDLNLNGLEGVQIMSEKDFLKMVEDSIKAGGSGCLVGRNLSEERDIEKMTRATAKVIREGSTAEEALKEL